MTKINLNLIRVCKFCSFPIRDPARGCLFKVHDFVYHMRGKITERWLPVKEGIFS